jgi:hypothetical protein
MATLDENIAQKRAEAQRTGESPSSESSGRLLELDDIYERTPEEMRRAFRALREAGFVPPEVHAMKHIAALRKIISADPQSPEIEALQRRLIELQQHLDLMLEKLRRSAGGG